LGLEETSWDGFLDELDGWCVEKVLNDSLYSLCCKREFEKNPVCLGGDSRQKNVTTIFFLEH
jgi:hypothetical protein